MAHFLLLQDISIESVTSKRLKSNYYFIFQTSTRLIRPTFSQDGALSISRAPLGLMRTLHTNGYGSEGEELPANAIQQGDGLWVLNHVLSLAKFLGYQKHKSY